ncbi:hypothetical protein ALC62_05308 [Cyphomyrmex costatus]|uniref:Uncharacterized protein n=1 Tax=Cyphomyrmex costatus TaxID=456900 RepID=A0A195CSX3_9HYME|nr:hypothetical protein ALC62_05308 [Cyphomyrmex costatus]
MAPKSTYSGKHVLDTAVYISVGIFNDSLSSIMRLMQNLGITIGPNCFNFCVEMDKSSRKEAEQACIDMHGQMYGAGIAD